MMLAMLLSSSDMVSFEACDTHNGTQPSILLSREDVIREMIQFQFVLYIKCIAAYVLVTYNLEAIINECMKIKIESFLPASEETRLSCKDPN